MTTKLVDSKGRIALGRHYAGRMVIIDDSDPCRLIITPAVAVPEREAWLYQNPEALSRVRQGQRQAQAKSFAPPPNIDADASLARKLAD